MKLPCGCDLISNKDSSDGMWRIFWCSIGSECSPGGKPTNIEHREQIKRIMREYRNLTLLLEDCVDYQI